MYASKGLYKMEKMAVMPDKIQYSNRMKFN